MRILNLFVGPYALFFRLPLYLFPDRQTRSQVPNPGIETTTHQPSAGISTEKKQRNHGAGIHRIAAAITSFFITIEVAIRGRKHPCAAN
jgi:hypothetical protein